MSQVQTTTKPNEQDDISPQRRVSSASFGQQAATYRLKSACSWTSWQTICSR